MPLDLWPRTAVHRCHQCPIGHLHCLQSRSSQQWRRERPDYGSVSVVAVLLGGGPPGSVPVPRCDSLRIRPPVRALLLTCPSGCRHRPGPPVGLIRPESASSR
jgi:hypothetical protein